MLKNKNLINYLNVILNKKIESISNEDFDKITNLNFLKADENGNQIYELSELLNFKNVENLTIHNSKITSLDIKILSSLSKIRTLNFDTCFFEQDVKLDLSQIKSLDNLSMKRCHLDNYNVLENIINLKSLEICFPYNDIKIDMHCLINLKELNKLILEGCIIFNELELKELHKLELLYLIFTYFSIVMNSYIFSGR